MAEEIVSVDLLAVSYDKPLALPLAKEVFEACDHISDETGRLKVLENARSLVRALETPRETMIRLCWAEPTLYAAITIAIDLHLFAYMHRDIPTTVLCLSMATGADYLLLSRIMKHLAAMGVIVEHTCDEYFLNNFSQTLAHPKYGDGFPCFAKGAMPSIYHLPEYFVSNGYKTPVNSKHGPFQYALETTSHWFNWAFNNPPVLPQFNNHMRAYHQGRPSWMDYDFYPVQDRLFEGFRPETNDVVVVDIGGGLGHDLEEFIIKHPGMPGRLVLQDMQPVIHQIESIHIKIQPMIYDFFTEQPVRGARAYYMHSVLHDWPDDNCYSILANVAAAMIPGYSRLLINENVVPDVSADWQVTGLDLMVMTLVSARERKEAEWRQLLKSSGLHVIRIWSHKNGGESLIECELAV